MTQPIKLRETELHPFKHRTVHYTCRVPSGTTLADLFTFAYWTDVATKMRVGALIEVLSEDGSLDCDLRVIGVTHRPGGQPEVSVKLLRNGFLPDPAGVKIEPLTVKWAGPKAKWRIMRGDAIVASEIDTEAAAKARVEEMAAA